MQGASVFLLGGLLGIGCWMWEQQLIKEFDEISEKSKWSIWVLPVATALLAIGSVVSQGSLLETLFCTVISGMLVLLISFDFQYMLLPTKVIVPGGVIAAIYKIAQANYYHDPYILVNAILGGVIGFILFLGIFYGSLWLLKKEGLGFGDVRFMAFLGLISGIDKLFLLLILSSFLGIIVGGILYVIKKKSVAFAFGPYLGIAGLLLLLYGDQMINFYLRCVSL